MDDRRRIWRYSRSTEALLGRRRTVSISLGPPMRTSAATTTLARMAEWRAPSALATSASATVTIVMNIKKPITERGTWRLTTSLRTLRCGEACRPERMRGARQQSGRPRRPQFRPDAGGSVGPDRFGTELLSSVWFAFGAVPRVDAGSRAAQFLRTRKGPTKGSPERGVARDDGWSVNGSGPAAGQEDPDWWLR